MFTIETLKCLLQNWFEGEIEPVEFPSSRDVTPTVSAFSNTPASTLYK